MKFRKSERGSSAVGQLSLVVVAAAGIGAFTSMGDAVGDNVAERAEGAPHALGGQSQAAVGVRKTPALPGAPALHSTPQVGDDSSPTRTSNEGSQTEDGWVSGFHDVIARVQSSFTGQFPNAMFDSASALALGASAGAGPEAYANADSLAPAALPDHLTQRLADGPGGPGSLGHGGGSTSIDSLFEKLSNLDKSDAELAFERGALEKWAQGYANEVGALIESDADSADELKALLEDGITLAELRSATDGGFLDGLSPETLEGIEGLLDRDREIVLELRLRDRIVAAADEDGDNDSVEQLLALRADLEQPNAALEELSKEDIEAARADLQALLNVYENDGVALIDGFPDSRGRLQSPEMAGTRLADVQELLAADRALALELVARGESIAPPPAELSEDLKIGLLLAEQAIQTLGVPYNNSGGVRFGGEGDLFDPNVRLNGEGVRFDCSGLTSVLYLRAVGLEVATHSTTQLRSAPEVSFDELRPGDIVGRPGHIGMYIGGGKYIHAPQTGDVVHIRELRPGSYPTAVRPRGENMEIDDTVFESKISEARLSEIAANYTEVE